MALLIVIVQPPKTFKHKAYVQEEVAKDFYAQVFYGQQMLDMFHIGIKTPIKDDTGIYILVDVPIQYKRIADMDTQFKFTVQVLGTPLSAFF